MAESGDITKHLIEYGVNVEGLKKAQSELARLNEIHKRTGQEISSVVEIMTRKVSYELDKAGQVWTKFIYGWKSQSGQLFTTVSKVNTATGDMAVSVGKGGEAFRKTEMDLGKLMSRALVTIPVWWALRAGFMAVIGAFQDGIKFMVEWEYQMAQIRIVGGGTNGELKNLSSSLLKLASSLGISHQQLGDGAKLWAQQGRALKEIVPLMEATAKMSMLSRRSITESVEDLTAVMTAYNITAENSIKIVDSLENVELKHAITTASLSAGLRNVASTASAFGISFEKLQGIITASEVATRAGGARIGNAFRTIFTRLTTSAKDAVTDIAKVNLYLDNMGKPTSENTGRLRDLGSVLDELGMKWSTLTKAEQMDLATKMAGRNRINELIGYLNNYNEAVRAEADALFSAGKSAQATAIMQDTLKNKLEGVTQAFHNVVLAVGKTEAFKGFLDGTRGALLNMATVFSPVSQSLDEFNKKLADSSRQAQINVETGNAVLETYNKFRGLSEVYDSLSEAEKKNADVYVEVYKTLLQNSKVPVPENIHTVVEMYRYLSENLSKIQQDIVKDILSFRKARLSEEIGNLLSAVGEDFQKGMTNWGNKASADLYQTFLKQFPTQARDKNSLKNFATWLVQSMTDAVADESKEGLLNQLILGGTKDPVKQAELKKTLDEVFKKVRQIKDIAQEEGNITLMVQGKTTPQSPEEITRKTAEQLKEELQSAKERQSLGDSYIEVLKAQLTVLNQQGAELDDALENERLRLEVSLKRAETEEELARIKTQGELSGLDEGVVLRQQLDYMSRINAETDKELMTKRRTLEVDLAKLENSRNKQILDEQTNIMLEKMEALGYSNLEIEIQRLAILKERAKYNGDEQSVIMQQLKVQQMAVQEINKGAGELRSAFQGGIADLLNRKTDINGFFDSIRTKIGESFANAISENFTNSLFKTTGIGDIYGQTLLSLRTGGEITYQNILLGFQQGSQMAYSAISNAMAGSAGAGRAMGAPMTVPMGGTMPMGGLPPMVGSDSSLVAVVAGRPVYSNQVSGYGGQGGYTGVTGSSGVFGNALGGMFGRPIGQWWGGGQMTWGQGLMAFAGGAMMGSQGGVGSAVMSGIGSLLMTAGHPILGGLMLLGSLLFGNKKKTETVHESNWNPEDVKNMIPYLGMEVAPLPKLYPLPTSRYFGRTGSIQVNLNIAKIEGTDAKIAETIARQVEVSIGRTLSTDYQRNIMRGESPSTLIF